MANIIHDIKSILEFYQDLGFEMLPIKLEKKTRRAEEQKYGKTTTRKLKNLRTSEQKEAALKALSKDIGDCKRCRLSKERTYIVFGEGNPDARLMFIGEAPGREEDSQGRPFVGDAGMLLTRLIEKMGLKRGDVYIANIIKCRPPMNRDPEMDEVGKCSVFLERQITIINPRVIM